MKDEKDQLRDDGMTRYSRCAGRRERPTRALEGTRNQGYGANGDQQLIRELSEYKPVAVGRRSDGRVG